VKISQENSRKKEYYYYYYKKKEKVKFIIHKNIKMYRRANLFYLTTAPHFLFNFYILPVRPFGFKDSVTDKRNPFAIFLCR